ncbi:MAG: hypothetical protein A2Z17_01970 [Gammaproteobacteria bacterium RBG_16_66_13]|nr:MAG: hypothetical protein A2Z17_01970 [Gammaproteobacteria bacterium RBG_16_66_13]
MSVKEMAVQQSVEVPTDSETAFKLWTAGINEWWKRGSHYWNDGKRALGLRFEPSVGGRFIEVYDAATGEGLEIGRIRVWEPGKRLVYGWREADWAAEEITEVEVLFESVGLGQTRVTVTHSGWETVRDPERNRRLREGYGYGLNELLGWYREASAARRLEHQA